MSRYRERRRDRAQDPEHIDKQRRQEATRLAQIEEAAKAGFAPVGVKAARLLRSFGVPARDNVRLDRKGTRADLHLVPASCAKLVKLWEEAQLFAGPAAHTPFRLLKLETVCKLAADEYADTVKG